MPVPQFRSVGPVVLEDCSKEEIQSLREAMAKPGSQLRTVVLYVDKDDEKGTDTVHVFGNAFEKLSACMWAKKFGVSRIQKLVVQCTDGIEQTARAHRAKWGIDLESEERYDINSTTRPDVSSSVQNQKRKAAAAADEDRGESDDDGVTVTTTTQAKKQAREEENAVGTSKKPAVVEYKSFASLLDHVMLAQFGWKTIVTPEYAWRRFHQWSYFYHRHKKTLHPANPEHMTVIMFAMRQHELSNQRWKELAAQKEKEAREAGRVYDDNNNEPPAWNTEVGQVLKAYRFPGKAPSEEIAPEKAWAVFEGLAQGAGLTSKREIKEHVMAIMCFHKQTDWKWGAYALSQNNFPSLSEWAD